DSVTKVANYSPCGSKDLLMEDPANLQSSCGMGSKDLVLEDDSAPHPSPTGATSLAPAEYAVAPTELMKRGQVWSVALATLPLILSGCATLVAEMVPQRTYKIGDEVACDKNHNTNSPISEKLCDTVNEISPERNRSSGR
ncbi:MAG: hypothetical protein ACRERV_16350, partial [Methylococcales bacterium]